MCRLLIFIFLFANAFAATAQKNFWVQYVIASPTTGKTPPLQSQFNNTQQAKAYIVKLPNYMRSKGFIAASVDSVLYKKDTAVVQLYFGTYYTWANINVSSIPFETLLVNGWDLNAQRGVFSFDKIVTIQNKLLQYYQEKGYPFAKIALDSVQINNDTISANLKVDTGFSYKIDSIRVLGKAKISNSFLQKYLLIKNNSRYKKSALDNITRRLNQLPYVEQQFPYDLTMLTASAVVNLYLKPKKSSIINILLGVIPAPNPNGLTTAPRNKLFLSGDVNILLNNALAKGETIGLTYQQLSINSRRVNLLYKHPYVFKTNYGIETQFELYKRDSSYINIDANAGILYALGDNTNGKLFIQSLQTNSRPDTTVVQQTKRLPPSLDVNVLNLGFQYSRTTVDYLRNPSKGNDVKFTLAFGTKKITKSDAITSLKSSTFNYASLYDSVKLNTYQLTLKLLAAQYISLRKQMVLKFGLQAGYLQSQNYFRNELFLIGGFKTLRGFDEESQFCNKYGILTSEWRYLIGNDSYFFAFIDGAFTSNQVFQTTNHTYLGTGLGLNFATKTGIFNLSVAVGARNDIPLGFKQTKLHFGYVSIF
jgi:outer membrane protein assembly factor BamA